MEKETTKKTEAKATHVRRVRKPVEHQAPEVGEAPNEEKSNRYFEAIGRRKTSVARARLFTQGEKTILVNGKSYKEYFPGLELQQIVVSPLERMKCEDRFRIVIVTKGGGIHSQAEAVRHALSRGLVLFNETFKKRLKKVGFITRDARERERKKFGLKRARRAPQWQKR